MTLKFNAGWTTGPLGLSFRPMTENDRLGLAGASDTALISSGDSALVLWDPETSELIEIDADGREIIWQVRR